MSVKKKITIGLLLNFFLLAPVQAADGSILKNISSKNTDLKKTIVGTAYHLKTGTLLYTETYHHVSDVLSYVEYSEPEGEVFGRKTIDLSESAMTPSIHQINERNGEEIEVKQKDDEFIVLYKKNGKAKPKSEHLKVKAGIVIDAGFDGFIKQYWTELVSGKTFDVNYLVPSKLTTFGFRFSRSSCIDGTKEGAMCFSLSPLSWVVKLAVDPIIVAYDHDEKRLLRFSGRGNIANSKGRYDNVDIQYRYF